MKKVLVSIILTIGFIANSTAQVSKANMLEKVKSLHPTNRISAKMDAKGYEDKVWEKGAWVYYYRHGYTVISKTEYPGITHKYRASLQYKKTGNQYIYDLYTVGDGEYLGVPTPDKTKLLDMLQADMVNFLGDYHYRSIVGNIPEVTLVDESTWRWPKLNMLEFKAKAVFTEKISAYKTQTSEHVFQVVAYSDAYKGKWNRFVSRDLEAETKQLATKEYSYDELKALKTLEEMDTETQAKKELSGLPSVTIPTFSNDKDLYYFVHQIIMTKDAETVKSYLYKVMSKQCKEEGSEVTLTYLTQQWVDKITNNLDTYKKTHCLKPQVKHYQNGQIRFFDKQRKRVLDFEGIQEDGKWKLYSVRYYPARGSEIEAQSGMNCN